MISQHVNERFLQLVQVPGSIITFVQARSSRSTVSSGTHRRRGRSAARHRRTHNLRTSYGWYRYRKAGPTSASRGTRRWLLISRFLSLYATDAKVSISIIFAIGLGNRSGVYGSYQISFGSYWYQDQIVTDANFLTLGSLLRRWMHGPPTSFSC